MSILDDDIIDIASDKVERHWAEIKEKQDQKHNEYVELNKQWGSTLQQQIYAWLKVYSPTIKVDIFDANESFDRYGLYPPPCQQAAYIYINDGKYQLMTRFSACESFMINDDTVIRIPKWFGLMYVDQWPDWLVDPITHEVNEPFNHCHILIQDCCGIFKEMTNFVNSMDEKIRFS